MAAAMTLPPRPPTHINIPGQYHATVEEHYGPDENVYASSPSSSESSLSPSRDEPADQDDYDYGMAYVPSLDLSARLVLAQAHHGTVSRRDHALDLARSMWGLLPPTNFGHVDRGIFRSAYPRPENFQFLRAAGFKTILTLVPGEPPEIYQRFLDSTGITHIQIGIEPNKDPKITIGTCKLNAALAVILETKNHPMLVHCNKGKHRTGTVIGCLRKVMGWELDSGIIREYRHFAGHKARRLDERYIEKEFDERGLAWMARANGFLPQLDSAEEASSSVVRDITNLALTGS